MNENKKSTSATTVAMLGIIILLTGALIYIIYVNYFDSKADRNGRNNQNIEKSQSFNETDKIRELLTATPRYDHHVQMNETLKRGLCVYADAMGLEFKNINDISKDNREMLAEILVFFIPENEADILKTTEIGYTSYYKILDVAHYYRDVFGIADVEDYFQNIDDYMIKIKDGVKYVYAGGLGRGGSIEAYITDKFENNNKIYYKIDIYQSSLSMENGEQPPYISSAVAVVEKLSNGRYKILSWNE